MTPQPKQKLVIALRPQYAEAILDGSKVWELRRQCPVKLYNGMTVLLYCEGHILGEATCDHWDLCGSGDDIARRHWRGSTLRYEEAQAYMEDARRPGALHLTQPRRYAKPMPWNRSAVQNFLYL